MGAIDIYGESEKISSWLCYRCGEVIDEQILINRRMSKPARGKSTEMTTGQA